MRAGSLPFRALPRRNRLVQMQRLSHREIRQRSVADTPHQLFTFEFVQVAEFAPLRDDQITLFVHRRAVR